MREFNQGGGPVRNSYVTERSVPYTRDYGGNIFSLLFKAYTNLFQLHGKRKCSRIFSLLNKSFVGLKGSILNTRLRSTAQ